MCSRHHFARFFLANFAALNDVSVISTPAACTVLHDSSNSTDLVSDIIAFRLEYPVPELRRHRIGGSSHAMDPRATDPMPS